MAIYKLVNSVETKEPMAVFKIENGFVSGIPFDPANTDYQAFKAWLEEGNTPEPADEGEA